MTRKANSSKSSGELVAPVEHWQDSGPRRLIRSTDLALYDPPIIELEGKVVGNIIRVKLRGGETAMNTRWQCEGKVKGEGREVEWEPDSESDSLCVLARGNGGVAVASLRARDLLNST
jgi:hypothetical protein